MTKRQRIRYDAAHLLALAASNGAQTLVGIARDAAVHDTAAIVLARRTLWKSLEAGNWREQRAEAEARLRSWR